MIIYIYALLHPVSKDVRYVGKTGNINNRYSSHLSASKNLKTHLGSWIKSLIINNLLPEIIILEKCSLDNWEEREIYHISQYTNLVNHHKGGNQPLPKTKNNVRKYRIRFLANGEVRYEVRCSYYNTVKQLGTFKSEKEAISVYDDFQLNPKKYINKIYSGVKKQVLLFKDSVLIKEFISLAECSKYINGDSGEISRCCRGIGSSKSHKGYTFKYKGE